MNYNHPVGDLNMKSTEEVYRNRITDSARQLKFDAFGVTLMVGPKGCGKTTTAMHFANSYIEFQDNFAIDFK